MVIRASYCPALVTGVNLVIDHIISSSGHYVTTLVSTVYNGSGFTVAPVYLAWLIPPLVGERAGAQQSPSQLTV